MNQRAISFTAFCTVGQGRTVAAANDVLAAMVWCQRNGYALEQYAEPPGGTLELPQGAPCLGGLYLVQYHLRRGLVKPGTALILEALNGVPRDELPKAIALLTELIEAGLTVVTLVDNKVWDAQTLSRQTGFMSSVVTTYSKSSDSQPGFSCEGD